MILTQKYVLKFIESKNEIKANVDFLKFWIFIEFFSSVIFLTYSHGLSTKSHCFHYTIPFLLLNIEYFLWTMSSNLRIRIVENNLTLILNRWLGLELKILFISKWKTSKSLWNNSKKESMEQILFEKIKVCSSFKSYNKFQVFSTTKIRSH